MTENVDSLLSTNALARKLNVSTETIRKWRRAGKIRPALETPSGRVRWSWPPDGMELKR